MAEATFILRAVDATKQAFANVQNSLAKLQQSSQTAAGFMKKAFDPRAIGAGLAASLGVSLIGVIDLAIKKLIELAMRANEVGKILAESNKTIEKMREDAAFSLLVPESKLEAIDEKRIKNAAEILRLKKATQSVESQMPSVLQGESFSPVRSSNLGTVVEAEKLSKLLAEDQALADARIKLIADAEKVIRDRAAANRVEREVAEADALQSAKERVQIEQVFQQKLGDTIDGVTQSVTTQTEAQKQLGKSLSESVMTPMEKYVAALERIDLLHASDTIDTETMIRLTGEAGAAFAATSGDVEDMASRLSMVNEEANKTIPAMSQLAQMSNDAGSLIAQGFEDAILSGQKLGEVVRSLGRDLVRLVFSQLVTQPLAAGIGGAIKGAFGFRAMGGPVASGSPYVVGEKGPELFVPHASGTIVPNNKMGGGSGSGGGSVTVNYNIAAGVSRAELVPILDQERRRLKAEIPDMVRRGGGYRAAFA
jgi:hypothetical protein